MKIKPNKHFDISSSVIYKTTEIIQILLLERYLKFNELFYRFKNKDENNDLRTFIFSLNLLFVLGKIEYYKESDTIGLINYET